jgi:NAD(P)H-hydrate epimerase
LFTGDARDYCGDVVFADLGVPAEVYARIEPAAWRTSLALVGRPLGPRPRRAHKGRFGHVLVVGGDHGYGGAARLCAEAAARTGAGLTSVATRAAHVAPMVAARPELMVRSVEEEADLQVLVDAASVLAVGPGLGRGNWGRARLQQALATSLPRVLDADALNWLSEEAALVRAAVSAPCVVTPHPGEASRLLGVSTREVESDRFAAAGALVRLLGCVVVLKGAGTLVQAPGRRPRVVEGGNPGMASGGMGDLLTGIVAALLAQGLAPFEAAVAGVALHAAAGDAAADDGGERGLLAGDLLPHVRRLAQAL